MYPGIEDVDFTDQSLYALASERWGATAVWADTLLAAQIVSPEDAILLRITPGLPVLISWRITLTETNDVMEYVKSTYQEKFNFRVRGHRID
jgi:GntR family transcriptional regulator